MARTLRHWRRLSRADEPMSAPLPNLVCPLCGGANQCAPATSGHMDTPCWCQTASISAEALTRIPPELVMKACLCPRCATAVEGDAVVGDHQVSSTPFLPPQPRQKS